MISAKESGLFRDEFLLNFRKERIGGVEISRSVIRRQTTPAGADSCDLRVRIQLREFRGHVTGEARENGLHPQLAYARENLHLEMLLTLDIGLGKRAAPTIEICHAMPRQMSGTGKISPHLIGAHSVTLPNAQPHRFLSALQERTIDAVQCHPIDESLPFGPAPPRCGVAEIGRAHV